MDMTEQPDTGSESSVQERLVQFFAKGEPEAAEPAEESDEFANVAEAGDDAEQAEAPADEGVEQVEASGADLVDVEIDGETFRAPAKVRDAVMAQTKFTREMQALGTQRKQVEDRAMFVEAREAVLKDIVQDASELRSKQSELERLQAIDFAALSGMDTTQALALMDRKATLQREVQDLNGRLQQRAAHAQQMQQQHRAQQWQTAVEGARQLLGTYSPADDAAAAAYVKSLGIDQQEAMQLLAHPKLLVMAFHAAKYQQAKTGNGAAQQKAAKAPPVIKPGSTKGPSAQQLGEYTKMRSELKRTGDQNIAARLLARRFAKG